jgi:hypothetical protein
MNKLFFILLYSLPFFCNGQYFNSGQDPSGIKWDQIHSENFQIIYPQEFRAEAQRLANSLEAAYIYNTQTLKIKPKKISVILHNFSSVSNAFVAWAPKRSEFYTIPPQDIYPQDWLNQLAIHEYRHVVQLSQMNQGLTRILYFLFGEQIIPGVMGLYVPFWFLEGDAVVSETALSSSGRGRLPEFEMRLRAQVLERKIYPYEKAVFGSYKDFIPDRYVLGYQLSANARKRYGAEIWDKTLSHVARHPVALFPFSHGFRKISGLSKWKYYKSCLHELDSLWKEQKSKTTYTFFEQLNLKPKKVFTNYRYPQFLNDSQVVALKSGLADIAEYVLLNKEGSEKRIFQPGFIDPVWLSVRKNLIVWAEYSYDKRWDNRTWYDIISYDINTGKRKRLSRKKYLFAPRLSNDASKIAAIEVSAGNQYSLVIMDAKTGKELQKFSHPENNFLITPTWSEDGKEILLIVMNEQGKGIASVDLETKSFKILLPYSFRDISHPVKNGDYIYYHGIYSGIDNIYQLEISSGKIRQVTSSEFGAFDPEISPDGKDLLFAGYTSMGFNISRMDLKEASGAELESISDHSIKLYQDIAAQEKGILNFDSFPVKDYPSKRYRKFPHLLNIHSWVPLSVDISSYNINPGITLLSQNKLSTAEIQANYTYNYNERAGGFTTTAIYQAWYPVIAISTSNMARASIYSDTNGIDHRYTWHEQSYGIRISQNLNLTRGKYIRNLNFAVQESYDYISPSNDAPADFENGQILIGGWEAEGYRLLKLNARDMRSRMGQSFLISYQSSQAGDFSVKKLLSMQASVYLPGIAKHHSLKLTAVHQIQGEGIYSFSSPVNHVRGFSSILGYRSFSGISGDYKLPLAYPDFRLGPVLYLKRIKANVFYDYGLADYSSGNQMYNSIGIEITNDLHLFNLIAPLEIGLRYIYRQQADSGLIQLLFNIDVGSL